MDAPLLDKVPGYNIYIDWKFADKSPLIQGYQHLHIPVNDVDDENLIEWFPKSNAFIEQGLSYWQRNVQDTGAHENEDRHTEEGSGVLVHCAMGKSRSATVVIAHLLWHSRRYHSSHPAPTTTTSTASSRSHHIPSPLHSLKALTPETALSLLRQSRPFVEPNDGFMEQLRLYYSMGCPDSIDSQPKYQRWLYQKTVQESLNINRAPELDNVRFEDEYEEAGDSSEASSIAAGKGAEIDIKCRKCRRLLAKSNFLIEHEPSPPSERQQQKLGMRDAKECAHLFLHPLSWMKSSLKDGTLDGRLCCPNLKCGANVGKFAWQGMRCSCGGWVTPGFGLARGKVDEVAVVRKVENGGATGVRLPPGMRKEGGHL